MSKQIVFAFCVFLSFCAVIQAQERVPVEQLLESIQKEHNVQFNYASEVTEGITIFPLSRKRTLQQSLTYIEKNTPLYFSYINASIISIQRQLQLCGFLVDGSSLLPLEGANIIGASSYTTTDDEGFFTLKVTDVTETIAIRYLGYKTLERKAEHFNQTQCKQIPLYTDTEQLASVVLSGYLVKGIDKTTDGELRIDFSKFSLLPGLIESDVLHSLQALPGIQSIDETVSNINIRGGSNDQNLILWDEIKMYQTGHFFGLISSFNPQITATTRLSNNGTDVGYTDGVSGTIFMETEKNVNTHFKGNISLNFLSGDAFIDTPIGKKASLQIAARKSINDLVQTPTYRNYFDRITQETEIASNASNVINEEQAFDFYDASLRYIHQISDNDLLRLNFITNSNDLTFNESATINEVLETRESSVNQTSIAGGIYYHKNWSDDWSTSIQIYNTDYKLKAINANVLASQRFLQENVVSETGIRLKNTNTLSDQWQWTQGYNGVETEITNLNDVDVPRFRELRSKVVRTHSIFTQTDHISRDKSFYLKSGARVNYIDKFEKFIVEPRVSMSKRISNSVQLKLLGEFKHQNTSQIINFQNDFLGVEKRRWQLADNDTIPIIQSKQISGGVSYSKNGWLIDIEGYYKNVDGITTQSQGFTTKYEFTRAKGRYDVKGIDVLARKRIGSISSWLSYSYMKNDYTFESLEDILFPSNFDSTHSFSVGSTFSIEPFDLSIGGNWRTGAPTSLPSIEIPIISNEVNFGIANNTRLPDYFRLDVSGKYKFNLGQGTKAEIGAAVWNITNRENIINYYYRPDNEGNAQQFDRASLGLTTNFVARIYF